LQYETALDDLYEAEKLNGTNTDIKKLIVKIKEDLFKIHSGSTKSTTKGRQNKISGGDLTDVLSSVNPINSTPMLSRKNTLKSGSVSQESDDKQLNSSISSNKNNKPTIFNMKFKEETNL